MKTVNKNKVLFVLTGRKVETILQEGGAQAWRIDAKRAMNNCEYVVCIQNHKQEYHDITSEHAGHHEAFLIGKLKKVVESDYGKDRKKLLFSEYAPIPIPLPNQWSGNRNPVGYEDLKTFSEALKEHGNIREDIKELEFKTMPPVQQPAIPDAEKP